MSLSGVYVTAVESRPSGGGTTQALKALGDLGASSTSSSRGQRPFSARVKAFVALTKPRIIELLLITTATVSFQ